MKVNNPMSLLRILDEAQKILKTAKKGNNSIRGSNIYAKKFVLMHVESKKALKFLQVQFDESDKKSIVEQISFDVEKFFDLNTSESERKKLSDNLFRLYKTEIEFDLQKEIPIVSNNLFPLELFKNTRGYLERIGIQAAGSYDYGWFDASAVMIRRLLETLIIECFETHKISQYIKNPKGDFLYLDELITKLESKHGKLWNLSRNCRSSLPVLKKIGDQSAHSRFFTAKKPDIDKIKGDLRIVIEELLIISKLKT